MKLNKKGFTLIELLAVIVILAIIALIATPLVMSTIKKARQGAAVSSANQFIKAVETATAQKMMETDSTIPASITQASLEGLDIQVKNAPTTYTVCIDGTSGQVVRTVTTPPCTTTMSINTFTVTMDATGKLVATQN